MQSVVRPCLALCPTAQPRSNPVCAAARPSFQFWFHSPVLGHMPPCCPAVLLPCCCPSMPLHLYSRSLAASPAIRACMAQESSKLAWPPPRPPPPRRTHSFISPFLHHRLAFRSSCTETTLSLAHPIIPPTLRQPLPFPLACSQSLVPTGVHHGLIKSSSRGPLWLAACVSHPLPWVEPHPPLCIPVPTPALGQCNDLRPASHFEHSKQLLTVTDRSRRILAAFGEARPASLPHRSAPCVLASTSSPPPRTCLASHLCPTFTPSPHHGPHTRRASVQRR